MGGSMGFGKIQIFVLELACRMEADETWWSSVEIIKSWKRF